MKGNLSKREILSGSLPFIMSNFTVLRKLKIKNYLKKSYEKIYYFVGNVL